MKKWATGATIIAALMAAPTIASASTVDWATWSNVVTGATAGSATGTTADTTFTYTGELQHFFANYPSYTPGGTFSGGTVATPSVAERDHSTIRQERCDRHNHIRDFRNQPGVGDMEPRSTWKKREL